MGDYKNKSGDFNIMLSNYRFLNLTIKSIYKMKDIDNIKSVLEDQMQYDKFEDFYWCTDLIELSKKIKNKVTKKKKITNKQIFDILIEKYGYEFDKKSNLGKHQYNWLNSFLSDIMSILENLDENN
jgi:hypothetical protein